MSNTQLTPEQRKLLENPRNAHIDIYDIRRIIDGSEKYSDEDIHVITGAMIRNKYWGHYYHIILSTDDPRLLIPFLDDNYPHGNDLAYSLYHAILYSQFEKARILIEYGADIETTYAYAEVDDLEWYEDNLSEFLSPSVKSANKV
jgi:hypothetical protein